MVAPITALISPSVTPEARVADPAGAGRPAPNGAETTSRNRRLYLLLLRFLVVNLVAVALLAAAWMQGWVEAVIAADSTRLVLVIAGLFAAGLVMCTLRVWRTSWELNQAHADRPHPGSRVAQYLARIQGYSGDGRSLTVAALRAKLAARIAIVRQIASTLVLLGLIGTVVGFIIALSGVRPEAAGDAATVAPMVASLIDGMGVALYTTLVGAVLNIWLMVNFRMLATGTANLLAAIVERGEAHVGQ